MSGYDRKEIGIVLFGLEDHEVIKNFVLHYKKEIDSFIESMEHAFSQWKMLDKIITRSQKEEEAYVSALLYAALHSHMISLKLFISGLLVPAGNTQRCALECIALALLFSRPSLGIRDRYLRDQYSPNKAVQDVVKNHEKLGLNRNALKRFEQELKHNHQYSHPSRLSLSGLMTIDSDDPLTIFGGAFDKGKKFAYDKEILSKVGLAEIFSNIIQAVELNFQAEA